MTFPRSGGDRHSNALTSRSTTRNKNPNTCSAAGCGGQNRPSEHNTISSGSPVRMHVFPRGLEKTERTFANFCSRRLLPLGKHLRNPYGQRVARRAAKSSLRRISDSGFFPGSDAGGETGWTVCESVELPSGSGAGSETGRLELASGTEPRATDAAGGEGAAPETAGLSLCAMPETNIQIAPRAMIAQPAATPIRIPDRRLSVDNSASRRSPATLSRTAEAGE